MSVRYDMPKGRWFFEFKSRPEAERALTFGAIVCFIVALWLGMLLRQLDFAWELIPFAGVIAVTAVLATKRTWAAVGLCVWSVLIGLGIVWLIVGGYLIPSLLRLVAPGVLIWCACNAARAVRYLEKTPQRPPLVPSGQR